jgi:hypothetical protein
MKNLLSKLTLGICPLLLAGCVVVYVADRKPCPECSPGKAETAAFAEKKARGPGFTLFNVDFGPSREIDSTQTGAAVVGKNGDHWNTVARPFDDHHTEDALKWADAKPCPIKVEMLNLGGAWGFRGGLGLDSAMLDNFNYPANNKGGNSRVILHDVPAGTYDLYIYGHGDQPNYFGDYSVKSGAVDYGRKTTYAPDNSGQETQWIENRQYVRFSGLEVKAGDSIEILIRPGRPVKADYGRMISDAMIAGLQLVSAK